MKGIICNNCLQSETLCPECNKKLEQGIITKKDIDISRIIYNLSKKVKSLENIKLLKTVDATVLTIICGSGDGPMLVGRGGSVVKVLAKHFKKNIKIYCK